jgi:EAL domain-containing protein (putative c-di-GMP-specific phosphodiesterase class I)
VSPAEFIPVAEQSGLILELGQWVLAGPVPSWRRGPSPQTRRLTLAVNVSVHQFRQAGFVDTVRQALGLHGVDPSRLKLEITESMLASDQEAIINKMAAAEGTGCRVLAGRLRHRVFVAQLPEAACRWTSSRSTSPSCARC